MPDTTDDVLEIPVTASDVATGGNDSSDQKECEMPKATEIDALIDKLSDQAYAKTQTRMDGYAEQYASQTGVVATAMNQMFGMAVQIVNATALNRIPSGTANQVLEHNAVAAQPWAAGPVPEHAKAG